MCTNQDAPIPLHMQPAWLESTFRETKSIRATARLAGVSESTIRYHLMKDHGYRPRPSSRDQSGQRNPNFGRRHTVATRGRIRRAVRRSMPFVSRTP